MADARTEPQGDPPGIIAAVTATYTIGVLGGNMQPLLIGSMIDGLGLDPGAAGMLGSVELAAVALFSFVLATRMATLARRRAVLLAGAAAVVAYAASAASSSFAALLPWRLLAGAGAGSVLAIGNASVSACHAPDRIFAQTTIAGTVLITIILAVLPTAIAEYSYRGAYAGMALTALVLLPLLRWIPDRIGGEGVRLRGAIHGGLGVATALAAALLFCAQSAVWAFAERLAIAAQLDHQQTGWVLAGSTIAGLAGAGVATVVGTRAGRTAPLLAGVLATGLSLLGLVYTHAAASYSAMLVANGIAYLFMVPYVLGTAAALDVAGRWAAATVGAATLGAAFGPAIAGALVATLGYVAVGWLALALSILAAAALLPVGRALDRRVDDRREEYRVAKPTEGGN